jgi:hypothetical protein
MSSLYVICRCLYLLLHLLYLIHRQWRYSFHVCPPVTRCFPLMPSTFLLPVRHPLIILKILLLHLFQLPSQIPRYLLSALTALLFIVLVLSDWHGHHCVIFASGGWLRDRSIEGQLVNEAAAAASLVSA